MLQQDKNNTIIDIEESQMNINSTNNDMGQNQRRKRMLPKLMVYFLAGSIILGSGFGAGYGTANLIETFNKETIQTTNLSTNGQMEIKPVMFSGDVDGNYVNPVISIAQAAGPSIVTVISVTEQVAPGFFSNQTFESEGTGSGVIYKITDDGALVITNNHVIQNAKSVSIILDNGITLDGEVLGFDSRNDLALVKVTSEELKKNNVDELTPATIGDSKNLLAGELAVAIGNPMGKEFSQTVTVGVISAVDRELPMEDTTLHVIQTDAAINPGNSGGGLFNKNGEVIGINTAKLVDSSVEGMGFSIPMHIVLPIIEKIEKTGNGENIAYVMDDDRAYLGIQMGKPVNNGMPFGVYIQDVVENGPADLGGLKTDDIIVALNGDKIVDTTMLFDKLTAMKPGDIITLEVLRDEQFKDIDITLGRYGDFKDK